MANWKGASPMKILRALSGLLVLFVATTAQGAGQVIAGPDGPVEFIGLERWGAQDLFDAIQAIDPDRPFHACAIVMREDLGFADAAAIRTMDVLTRGDYTIMIGVEDSARVRHRPTGDETVAVPEAWQNLSAVVGDDLRTLNAIEIALPSRGGFLDRILRTSRRSGQRMGVDPGTLDQAWDAIDSADSEEDRRLAHEVLAKDSLWSARTVATLVLGNFGDDATTWHALAGSLIDPHARVSSAARSVLKRLIKHRKDPVDWSGARTHLVALLDGTNAFAFREILRIMVATDIDPDFGRQLIRESPELLLAHVGAAHETAREPALDFLKAVSGEDFGADVEAWTAWINDLGAVG